MKNYIHLLLVCIVSLQSGELEESAGPSAREILRQKIAPSAISRRAQKKAAFNTWREEHPAEEMAAQKGLPLEMVRDAFRYYNREPYGQLPDNKERIMKLAQANQRQLESRTINKTEFQRWQEEHPAEQMAAQKGLPVETVRKAYKRYGSLLTGDLPDARARILQLANSYDVMDIKEDQAQAKKKIDFDQFRREYPEEAMSSALGVDLGKVHNAYVFYSANPKGPLPNTKERILRLAQDYHISLERVKRFRTTNRAEFELLREQYPAEEMAIQKGLPVETVRNAYSHYSRNPRGPLPNNRERIEQLAQAYQRAAARQKADRVRKRSLLTDSVPERCPLKEYLNDF